MNTINVSKCVKELYPSATIGTRKTRNIYDFHVVLLTKYWQELFATGSCFCQSGFLRNILHTMLSLYKIKYKTETVALSKPVRVNYYAQYAYLRGAVRRERRIKYNCRSSVFLLYGIEHGHILKSELLHCIEDEFIEGMSVSEVHELFDPLTPRHRKYTIINKALDVDDKYTLFDSCTYYHTSKKTVLVTTDTQVACKQINVQLFNKEEITLAVFYVCLNILAQQQQNQRQKQ